MNRRFFALSWGRKIFFGISWPVSALLFLIYLQSYLIPDGLESWVYFISTSIAISGLFTTLAYFLIYYPLVSLLPGYYTSRVITVICVFLIQGGILLDATVFSRFRFHLKPTHFEILSDLSASGMVPFTSLLLILISLIGFIVFMLFHGGRLWKSMQKRFTNPVSSWYFFFIGLCFLVSHLIFSSENFQSFGHRQTIASVFPLNYQTLLQKKNQVHRTTTFKYPLEKMNCPGTESPNIFFIVIDNWGTQNFSEAEMPFVFHLPDHGTFFTSQQFHSREAQDGLFSLLYGIPAIHRGVAQNSSPVLFEELKKRDYSFFIRSGLPELVRFGSKNADGNAVQSFSDWESETKSPVFSLLELSGNDFSTIDQDIQKFFGVLHKNNLLQGSLVLITGSNQSDDEKMPLIIAWPNRRKGEWAHRTTHYDVAPTLMQEIWSCKNKFSSFSEGKSLFLAPEDEWETYGTSSEIHLFNIEKDYSLKGNWAGEIEGSPTKKEKIKFLKTLRHALRFYHR